MLLSSADVAIAMMRVRETTLEQQRVSRVYRERLHQGTRLVLSWLVARDLCVVRKLETNSIDHLLLDQWLAEFVNEGFDDSLPFWKVKHGILGLQSRFRHLRGRLLRTWDCIGSWEAKRAHRNRAPVSLHVLNYICAVAFSWALEDANMASRLFPMIVLIRVGFFGMLRPGELLKLTAADVSISTNAAGDLTAILALTSPKTRRFGGRSQFSLVQETQAVKWLEWLIRGLSDPVRLWPSSASSFRSTFKAVLVRGAIENCNFSPGGLRAGGATELVADGFDVGRLKFLGRWRAEKSMISYIQEAMSARVWVKIPRDIKILISVTVEEAQPFLRAPPRPPWAAFFSRGRQWRSMAAPPRMRR